MSRLPRAGTAGKPVTIRATAEERALWERAAERAGKSLSDWLRRLANRAAGRSKKR
jgi:uncharacterized protein (DUF1778 family)